MALENRSKEYIFDWVVGFENEALEHMREEVIKTAEFNFGKDGREVAEKYYRTIDGEEDLETDEIDEECNDCKEKAKRLKKNLDLIQYLSSILLKDSLDQIVKDIDMSKLDESLDNVKDEALEKTCFDVNPIEVKTKILLETCRRLMPNDNRTE